MSYSRELGMQADLFKHKRHWASAPVHSLLERAIAMHHGSSMLLSFEIDQCQVKFGYLHDHRVGAMRLSE